MTANQLGIAVCTTSVVVLQVCKAIVKYLGPELLHLHKTKDELTKKVSEFECYFGMKQAFGCIDGTHIPIRRPVENSQEFYNYKMFYSISAQAVCDYRVCLWTWIFGGLEVYTMLKFLQTLPSESR